MAQTTKLVLTFVTDLSKTISMTFSNVKESVSDSAVKNFVECITAAGNRVIFENKPVSCTGAKVVTTTSAECDLS